MIDIYLTQIFGKALMRNCQGDIKLILKDQPCKSLEKVNFKDNDFISHFQRWRRPWLIEEQREKIGVTGAQSYILLHRIS